MRADWAGLEQYVAARRPSHGPPGCTLPRATRGHGLFGCSLVIVWGDRSLVLRRDREGVSVECCTEGGWQQRMFILSWPETPARARLLAEFITHGWQRG